MGYIKSHSNYVIQKKHQDTNGGNIFERDITTIGGVNRFSKGQLPIYNSGNFIITARETSTISKDYSDGNWLKKDEDSTIWTYSDVEQRESPCDDSLSIVLKRDYYSLKDFAYFGSCSELIRASVLDIIKRFPGELYAISLDENSNSGVLVYPSNPTSSETPYSYEGCKFLVDNPFDVNCHSTSINKNEVEFPFRYLCNGGIKDYEFIRDDETTVSGEDIELLVTSIEDKENCVIALVELVIKSEDNESYKIAVKVGEKGEIIYLTNEKGWHLRPKQYLYKSFYNSLDEFQKLLLNQTSNPKYTACFEIINENEYGYYKTLRNFTFPTTYGGYNLEIGKTAYTSYLTSLIKIAEFYDERFCDNLYRNLTHESIKNFDWSFKREYDEETAESNMFGGAKMQKIIRLIGREFDEIKYYIDGISHSNTLTYDEANNLPDYFLADNLTNEGWDVVNIYPYGDVSTCKPYTHSITCGGKNGYFLSPCCEAHWERKDEPTEGIEYKDILGGRHYFIDTINGVENIMFFYINNQGALILENVTSIPNSATQITTSFRCNVADTETNSTQTWIYFDKKINHICAQEANNGELYKNTDRGLLNRIKSYSTEKEYSLDEVNNKFFKVLRLNSRNLYSHKGTIEGIEMLLGMFGLTSKRWVESSPNSRLTQCDGENVITPYDYEIKEYIVKSNVIGDIETIDNYNKAKTFVYDTDNYRNNIYVPYQGLPVKQVDNVLVPYFDKNAIIDGNPYYQMNGGWMFQDIITNSNEKSTSYTETLKSVLAVGTIKELLELPINAVKNNMVYHVNDISGSYVIINGYVYELNNEIVSDIAYEYFTVTVYNNTISVGGVVFNDIIEISSPYGLSDEENIEVLSLNDYYDGEELRIYNINNNVIVEELEGDMLATYWDVQFFKNGHIVTTPLENQENLTSYFQLDNVDYKQYLTLSTCGWKQLTTQDTTYKNIDIIKNYFHGNNPHSGNHKYDNGDEYLSYFTSLFKHAIQEEAFDVRCLKDDNGRIPALNQVLGEVGDYGFTLEKENSLKVEGEWVKTEDYFVTWVKGEMIGNVEDYFNIHDSQGRECYITTIHGGKRTIYHVWVDGQGYFKKEERKTIPADAIEIKQSFRCYTITNGHEYYNMECLHDDYSEQSMNVKNVDLTFYVEEGEDDINYIKYMNNVVMKYIGQMIPHNTILKVSYNTTKKR